MASDTPPTEASPLTSPDLRRVQRRTLAVLIAAQICSGVGVAVGLSFSPLIVYRLSGSEAISGFAGTAAVLGAALFALPTARVAGRGGRRAGLALAYGTALVGTALSIAAIMIGSWPLLLAGLLLFGGASAGNLAARYSAADLSPPGHAGRHLSWVIWAATVGSVTGPNLAHPAERAGAALGLAEGAGPFTVAIVTFLVTSVIVVTGLRPDPLLLARRARGDRGDRAPAGVRQAWAVVRTTPAVRLGLTAIAVSHTAMVSIMSMTPVHLDHGGAAISVIGLVLSLHIAGMYLLSPVVGWLTDRVGGRWVLVAGMAQLLAAAALAGGAGPHGTGQIAAGLVLLGTGWSCGLVAGSATLSEATPIERRPAVQGLSDLVMNVCGASGTVVAGLVVGAASYGALGAAVGALAVVTAVRIALGGRPRRAAR